jgi:hypothetical protein
LTISSHILALRIRPDDEELKEKDTKLYENEIKKLNYWDHKLSEALSEETDEIKQVKATVLVKNGDLESLNFINHFRENIKNRKGVTPSPAIKLINQINENQNTILLQNMNLTKLKFNFDVFNTDKHKTKEKIRDLDDNDFIRSVENIVGDDALRTKTNKELYKIIIRDTISMEMGFRKQ